MGVKTSHATALHCPVPLGYPKAHVILTQPCRVLVIVDFVDEDIEVQSHLLSCARPQSLGLPSTQSPTCCPGCSFHPLGTLLDSSPLLPAPGT